MKTTFIKLIIFGIGSLSIIIFLCAGYYSSNHRSGIAVPLAVQAAFHAKYPNIPHTWQRNNYGYEAVFRKNNIEYEAEFSEAGVWLETEFQVTKKDFPNAVLKRIEIENPQFIVTKYEIEITPRGKFYKVDITDGETESELYFDQDGNHQNDLYYD